MACLECRRRRIRCDSGQPKCHHCMRLSKKCEYQACEQRRGPKKRSVRELEQRLANIEAQLKAPSSECSPKTSSADLSQQFTPNVNQPDGLIVDLDNPLWSGADSLDFQNIPADFQFVMNSQDWPDTSNAIIATPIEPLLSSEVDKFPDLNEIQELNKIFFEEVYPLAPFIHHAKHESNRLHTLELQPPLCLRYVMWAHAAARSSKYSARAPQFYRNARMHLEHDEMQGDGLDFMTLAHVQTWALIAVYEAELATPARAYMSNRRAIALSHMLGLHKIDNAKISGTEVFKMLKPPQDFVEAEERRRTFWYIYFSDRWASAGIGQTPSIRDDEIVTLMPASENAFHEGYQETSQSLREAASEGLGQSAAPMAAAVLSAWTLEKCTIHLRQAQDIKDDLQEQQFWLQHQQLDNIVSKALISLPEHLRAASTREPLAFFVNMCLHEFIISLFQAAALVAQKSQSKFEMTARLRSRARRAAEEIVNIMRSAVYMNISKMSPFVPSCLYMAATVYINDLNSGHQVEHARETLLFILHIIKLFRKHWRVAQIFVAQLLQSLKGCDIDLDATPTDAMPLRCYTQIGEELDALGPLFSTDNFFNNEKEKHQLPEDSIFFTSEPGNIMDH